MAQSITDLKVGVVIDHTGAPWQVIQNSFMRTAQRKPVMRTKLRNLITGAVMEKTFIAGESFELADVEFKKCQYLYTDGTSYHFMDNETFEQFELGKDLLGDSIHFLLDGTDMDVRFFDERPISVNLPPKVTLEVTDTEPGVKGDTASGGSKPATLQTGITLQVPLFIKIGDKIKVNTETREYVERA